MRFREVRNLEHLPVFAHLTMLLQASALAVMDVDSLTSRMVTFRLLLVHLAPTLAMHSSVVRYSHSFCHSLSHKITLH